MMQVERHLDCIQSETVIRRHLQHTQMDLWVLVPRKTDIAEFYSFPGLHERGIRSFVIKDPVRVSVSDHLVVLDEINHVDLEATERLVKLLCRFLFGSAIGPRHQKYSVPVTITQRFAHADLAGSLVVIPAVIHEVDSAVCGGANDADAKLLIHPVQADMPTADPDCRDVLSRADERSIERIS
jgi:hypothetical protein